MITTARVTTHRRDDPGAIASDDELLAVASRELKHPLNVISANAQLLAALPEAQALPEVLRAARAIQREAMNQSRILETLLDQANDPADSTRPDDVHRADSDGEGGAALAGVRVLLVDDSADALETFAFLLVHEGLAVETAASGRDALGWIERAAFDVLVSDLGMPEMDGYALLGAVRARPNGATLPAIALTGYGRQQDIERAFEAGFQAHVDKPADVVRLKQVIADVLGAARRSRSAPG